MKYLAVFSVILIFLVGFLLFNNQSQSENHIVPAQHSDKVIAPPDIAGAKRSYENADIVSGNVLSINQSKSSMSDSIKPNMEDDSYVIFLARKAIGNSLEVPSGCETKINRTNDVIEVIFVYPIEKGIRGPDYYAKVEINANTGLVIRILAGS